MAKEIKYLITVSSEKASEHDINSILLMALGAVKETIEGELKIARITDKE